jgi:hypothetical protein
MESAKVTSLVVIGEEATVLGRDSPARVLQALEVGPTPRPRL